MLSHLGSRRYLDVRSYPRGASFGGVAPFKVPTAIPGSSDIDFDFRSQLVQDGGGRLQTAWGNKSGTLCYAVSDNGVSWSRSALLRGQGGGFRELRLASAPDHRGLAVYQLGFGSSAVLRAVAAAPSGAPCQTPPAGQAAAAPPDRTAPVISHLSVKPKRFRTRKHHHPLHKRGTRFRFRLSETARVTFTIKRPTIGRKVGGRCRGRTHKNRRRQRCVRFVYVGRFARTLAGGRNSVRFSGRLRTHGHTRPLRTGPYRASLQAKDAAGNRSHVKRVSFRVVKR